MATRGNVNRAFSARTSFYHLILLLIAAGIRCAAQSPPVPTDDPLPLLRGTVMRENWSQPDTPLEGASVTVLNRAGVTLAEAVTDDQGLFAVQGSIPTACYYIKVARQGYRDFRCMSVLRPDRAVPLYAALRPVQPGDFDIKGITLASWWNGEYSSLPARESLCKAERTGANTVVLLASWYMNTTPQDGEVSRSSTIYQHPQKTPSDDDVVSTIRRAKWPGHKVMLKMHVRVILSESPWADRWAGRVQPSDPQAWFDCYVAFARHYAQIAQDEKVDILCIGTELPSMTKPEYADQWNRVIDEIKTIYTGKLTFSSNIPGEYSQITFWSRMDYLGIGPYWSLTDEVDDPGLDALVDGWYDSPEGRLVDNLEAWQAQHGKPVLFTEIGYCSVDTASYKPWKGTSDLTGQPLPENRALQKRCYDALCLVFQAKPWFAGLAWWDWLCRPDAGTEGLERKEYTPQNKDAEQSIRNFFFGVNPRRIGRIAIVDGARTEVPDGFAVAACSHKNLYAMAYSPAGDPLGYVPCSWVMTGYAATLETGNGALARVQAGIPGECVVTADESSGHSDSVRIVIEPPRQLHVGPAGDYPTISAAMSVAVRSDVILIAPGTYVENVALKDGVSLVSTGGPWVTTIQGTIRFLPGSAYGYENSMIKGLTVTNPSGDGIAYVEWSTTISPSIVNNVIVDNGGAGITMIRSNARIINNIIARNSSGPGIQIDSGAPRIINNTIAENQGTYDGGGICVLHTTAELWNNIVVNNHAARYGGGIKQWPWPPADGFTIDYNDVFGNTAELGEPDYGTCPIGPHDISLDPLFTVPSYPEYLPAAGSPCIDAGDPSPLYQDTDGTRCDIGAYGGPTPMPPP